MIETQEQFFKCANEECERYEHLIEIDGCCIACGEELIKVYPTSVDNADLSL